MSVGFKAVVLESASRAALPSAIIAQMWQRPLLEHLSEHVLQMPMCRQFLHLNCFSSSVRMRIHPSHRQLHLCEAVSGTASSGTMMDCSVLEIETVRLVGVAVMDDSSSMFLGPHISSSVPSYSALEHDPHVASLLLSAMVSPCVGGAVSWLLLDAMGLLPS